MLRFLGLAPFIYARYPSLSPFFFFFSRLVLLDYLYISDSAQMVAFPGLYSITCHFSRRLWMACGVCSCSFFISFFFPVILSTRRSPCRSGSPKV
ncbi:hypothetical protein BDV25DRAFT_11310 [Aspergillus avenaceus]|uniref:Uncharacterized protein n=1 Tax=Aspergillus avenaceus TaxID=36643 RepID=A0A5N6TR31_ASPAV|nr:hypothetical protein BDV25DRAFT_11310 [Aspergillus avenaceus]